MPTMRFMDLAADPIGPAEALLSALRSWGSANWAADVLEHRAGADGWSTEMQQQATRAAEEFERECGRLEKGIELLKADEALFRAFTGMNRAMSFSARGKYDSWRPFQLGFLLANLSSVVDKEHEPDVVDVVWFATGGGKTETYLGLLVTAALYDRMTGKVSGITAWSRFPLRMLSLQQTQRFADAIASAEMVRREMGLAGDGFSLGFFVGQGATPNRILENPKPGEPDPDDDQMPRLSRFLYGAWLRPEVIEVAVREGGRLLQEGFDLREGHFDRVEVRTVGRQEAEFRACPLDRRADRRRLVGRQVVHHHDVAGPQRRDQDLLDIGEEGRAVHGAVQGHRRGHAGQAEGADEGGGLPVTVGNRRPAPLAAGRTAIHPGHLGRGPALVDEHQSLRVEIGLPLEPGEAAPGYVGTRLLGGVRGLFFRVTPWRWKNRQTMLGAGR